VGVPDTTFWWKRRALWGRINLRPGVDAIRKASDSTWWNWDEGSRPFHLRWPKWYQSIIQDGLPVYFKGEKPAYKTAQRGTLDEATKAKVKEKLSAVRKRRYVLLGFVKSLTSFFSVPKGDDDVRMVYNGTVSRLYDSIWVPRFLLPTVETHLRAVDEGTHMADVDVGECFLNFILHPEIREIAGVDLTHFFGDGDDILWEVWDRAAMGVMSSPYQAVSGLTVADEIIQGDRFDEENIF
jgi:hypothetical protein